MSNKIISPDSYRKKVYKEEVVEVPSGVLFKIKKISPMEFIEEGMEDIPTPFLEFVMEGKPEKFPEVVKDKKSSEFLETFLNVIIEKGILEPRVFVKYKKDRKEDGLLWAELEREDQAFLLSKIAGFDLKNV